METAFSPPDAAAGNLPRLNVLDLEIRHGFKNRVYLAQLEAQRQILKICPFKFELHYFTQEIKTYNTLSERGCNLIPRLSAYVFERSEEQIIGFICEEFQGRFAGLIDYSECRRSLLQLHSYGRPMEISSTTDGPRFFDLEKSVLDTNVKISKDRFSRLQQEEVDGLEKAST